MRAMRFRIRALMLVVSVVAVLLGCAAGELRLRRIAADYQSRVAEHDAEKTRLIPALVAMERNASASPESVSLRGLVLLRHQVSYHDFLACRYLAAARVPWKPVPDDPRLPTLYNLPPMLAKDVITEAITRKILSLDLRGCAATDSSLASLRECPNLRSLDLADNRLTDAGLVHLAGLEHLDLLILSNNNITDAGLVNLKGLKNLRKLNLIGTKITRAGLGQLTSALPSVEVTHDPDLLSGR